MQSAVIFVEIIDRRRKSHCIPARVVVDVIIRTIAHTRKIIVHRAVAKDIKMVIVCSTNRLIMATTNIQDQMEVIHRNRSSINTNAGTITNVEDNRRIENLMAHSSLEGSFQSIASIVKKDVSLPLFKLMV